MLLLRRRVVSEWLRVAIQLAARDGGIRGPEPSAVGARLSLRSYCQITALALAGDVLTGHIGLIVVYGVLNFLTEEMLNGSQK